MKKKKERDQRKWWEKERVIDIVPKDETYMNSSVYRFLPDRTKELIGFIEQDFSEYPPIFYSTDTKGEELFPPTTDSSELDEQLEGYARQLEKQQAERTKEVKKIRQERKQKNKNQQLTR